MRVLPSLRQWGGRKWVGPVGARHDRQGAQRKMTTGGLRIFGITGTNGKTTTAWILAAFLNAAPGPVDPAEIPNLKARI